MLRWCYQIYAVYKCELDNEVGLTLSYFRRHYCGVRCSGHALRPQRLLEIWVVAHDDRRHRLRGTHAGRIEFGE